MNIDFDHNNIVHQQLFVAVGEDETFVGLTTSNKVKEVVRCMLRDTLAKANEVNLSDLPAFELAERYGPDELVQANIADPIYGKLKAIHELVSVPTDNAVLAHIDRLTMYACLAIDRDGRKVVAIRRAQQLKAVAAARGRLIQVLDDSLEILDKPVFRLDRDFDLVITESVILALRASTLAYVADLGAAATRAAAAKLEVIRQAVGFLNASQIETFVATRKRAAQLVASIASRKDLARLDQSLIATDCDRQGIKLRIDEEGRIGPEAGFEMEFLEVLDCRRYAPTHSSDAPTSYLAPSRRPAPVVAR